MAKELAYFQFEPAQYLTGNIQFCSYELQGVFINVCAIYWQRSCNITREQLERKFTPAQISELITEDVIKIIDGLVSIEFLNEQFENITASKLRLSEAGKKGALIKKQATLQPPLNKAEATLQQLDEIREDEIREDEIRENIEYTRPRIFLKEINEQEFEQVQMKSTLPTDEYEKCIEQWSLSVEGSDFKYSKNKTEDYRKLLALFKKWINSWVENNRKGKKNPQQTPVLGGTYKSKAK